MTFLEIVLENVGPFRGRHVIDLRVGAGRSVIVFGALNGSGKTTLLNSFQLALYGRDSRPAQAVKSYHHYLRQLINNQTPLHDSASIELVLALEETAGATPLRVQRRWWRSDRKDIREQFTVFRGNEASEELTSNWDTFIANVLPARVADLFFLDGEKIEALTEQDQASAIIRKGIYTLLDLDQIEELRSNLRIVKRRRLNSIQEVDSSEQVAQLERTLNKQRALCDQLLQERASSANTLDRAQSRVLKSEDAFRESGGEVFEKRERWIRRQTELQAKLRHSADQLRQLASRELPIIVCADLLDQGLAMVGRSEEANRLSITIKAIRERDKEYIRILKELGLPASIGKDIAEELHQSVPTLPANVPPTTFGIRSERLERYVGFRRKTLQQDADRLLAETEKYKNELSEIEHAIESVPSEDQIAGLSKELMDANSELARIQAVLTGLDEQITRVNRLMEDTQKRLDEIIEAKLIQARTSAEAQRIARHVALADESLQEYLIQMVRTHSDNISAKVLKSFQSIARKSGLLSGFHIDAETFQMQLRGTSEQVLEPQELSAGERQILAFAILDGLAKSSGRRIPTLVDSPLGRLDSVHRRRIADHYFPTASHQTIVFSTDQEVDAEMLARLDGSIARSYLLSFDEREHATNISSGYFQTR